MSLTDALLGPVLRGPGSARPLLTYYDATSGERIELSGVTTANWAAKAANLLRDECDVEPGDRVAVLLPAHWQTATVLLAVWSCGAEVVADPFGAAAVLCDSHRLDLALSADAAAVVALSLDAFGKGLDGLPSGVLDFATEVRLHGDEFVPWEPVAGSARALGGENVDRVLETAGARAATLGIGAGDRVLSTLDWADRLVDGLLAPLAAGASLVQVRCADPDRLERIAASERVTVRLV
ncbi:MAG: TIGR03089 family protein [Pseudonocardia sp.]|nr:TIGR03089 family protein [Pseudonocardia sp.]